MLYKFLRSLRYDEVTLFVLNYAFLLSVVLQILLGRDVSALMALALNPLVLIYGISIVCGLYYSIKHIWKADSHAKKETREIFLMVGGGAWLAAGTAGFTLADMADQELAWHARLPALYTLLYNFIIIWFMGAVKGFEIAEVFMDERDAQFFEAVACTAGATALCLVLMLYFDWSWWRTVNACLFYVLSVNKLLLYLLHRR